MIECDRRLSDFQVLPFFSLADRCDALNGQVLYSQVTFSSGKWCLTKAKEINHSGKCIAVTVLVHFQHWKGSRGLSDEAPAEVSVVCRRLAFAFAGGKPSARSGDVASDAWWWERGGGGLTNAKVKGGRRAIHHLHPSRWPEHLARGEN